MNIKETWYNNIDILFLLIENLKYREGVFLRQGYNPIRYLKMNKINYLIKNMVRYRFLKEPFNIYASLAHLPNMPMFSFATKEKTKQMAEFNKNYPKYITKYDYLMDIDNPDINHALNTLKIIKKIFDENDIPYWIIFSGNKGFHIRVDYDDFDQEMKSLSFDHLIFRLKTFTYNFKMIEALEDIDTSIYDNKRIAKIPYSIVHKGELLTVAMPLSDDQIKNFKLSEMLLKNNLDKNFHKRGVLKRQGSGFGNLVNQYIEL